VLTHEAYVWQRAWTGAVREAVAAAPPELSGLRVLVLEVADGRLSWPEVAEEGDAGIEALVATHRPVTAVVRIAGSRPIAGLSLAPVLARLDVWRNAGVQVVGVEIDHDCATAALPEYATWLNSARVPAPLRWSITALPTWAGSPALPRVAAAVDEIVVQVHAVRAPSVFEPQQARRWLAEFARAVPDRPLRVAVPTYRVVVHEAPLAADPVQVARFVQTLARDPVAGVQGVVWFRLPVDSDRATWSTPTLRAVIAGLPLAPDLRIRLVEQHAGVFDVVLANSGSLDASYPALRFSGSVVAVDLVDGYRAMDTRQWMPPDRIAPAGSQRVIGWATGQGIVVDAN
jgi:hypothetical protein